MADLRHSSRVWRKARRKRLQSPSSGQSSYPSALQSTVIPLADAHTDSSSRRSRATIAEREALAEDTEEATKRKEAEAEERRKQSHDLVAESIRRELAESMLLSRLYPFLQTHHRHNDS